MAILSTPNGEVIIRIATPEDADALFKLRVEALTVNPEAFAMDVEKTITAGVDSWIKRLKDDAQSESGAIFIGQAGHDLTGMIGIGRGQWPKTRHSAIVWGVYVRPVWRGLHVGRAILNDCITWSRQHEIVVLKLGVVTTNEPAIRCYRSCGFTVYGAEPKSLYLNGKYYDEYLMALSLID